MILKKAVMKDEAILINANVELTSYMLKKLRIFEIESIEVIGKDNEEENASLTETDLSLNTQIFQDVRESLFSGNVDKTIESSNFVVSSILDNVKTHGDFLHIKYDNSQLDEDDYLSHIVRSSIYSIILAYLYNETLKCKYKNADVLKRKQIDLPLIALGCLLQERGQKCNNPEVLEKIKFLKNNTAMRHLFGGLLEVPIDKFSENYTSLYSFCLISSDKRIPDDVKYMVAYSLEKENGTGPLKANGFGPNNDSPTVVAAKIIHICSLYDKVLAHLLNNNIPLENIISILGQCASTGIINESLTQLFLENIPIYSIGANVVLSNGEIATVIEAFSGYVDSTRPVVKVESGKIYDLREENSITVLGLVMPKSSDDAVFKSQLDDFKKKRKN